MKSVLREPLVHFFVLGLAVFGLFAIFDDTPEPRAAQLINVTVEDASRLAAEFEARWRRSPTPDELDLLIAQYIREEVYTREAIALGLDQGDTIIRRRLQQKMEFLTEAGAEAANPDDATLAAHLAANAERFSRAPLLAFEQIMLVEATANELVPEIRASLNRGRDPLEVARPSLLPPSVSPSPPRVIDSTFGSGFFDQLEGLPLGEWAGPVTSSYGRHLVRISERRAVEVPTLDEIRGRVLMDWRTTLADRLREDRYQAMRLRYEIVRPDAEEVLGR